MNCSNCEKETNEHYRCQECSKEFCGFCLKKGHSILPLTNVVLCPHCSSSKIILIEGKTATYHDSKYIKEGGDKD